MDFILVLEVFLVSYIYFDLRLVLRFLVRMNKKENWMIFKVGNKNLEFFF